MTRNIIIMTAATLCVYMLTASAQLLSDSHKDTVGGINVINSSIIDTETVNAVDTVDTINTANAVNIVDTVDTIVDTTANTVKAEKDAIDLNDDELLQAALAVDSAIMTQSTQKSDLIRRDYEYKRQTRAAIIMMIFIAAAMATSQSWNPR